jgi:hypothetical protein
MLIVASSPAVNLRKSLSMPSEKTTPLSGMRERSLRGGVSGVTVP